MFCNRVVIDLEKKDDIWNLRPVGDVHLGNRGFAEEEFERTIKTIESSERYLTLGIGDYIDNVQAYANGGIDKRWNPETVDRKYMTTEEQINKFVNYWKRVAGKSLGMHSGNHEWKTVNQARFINDFCNPIEKTETVDDRGFVTFEPKINSKTGRADTLYHQKYLGRLAYTNLGFDYKGNRIRDFLILSLHGGYSGTKGGGAVNRMKDIVADFDCDVCFMGHNHDTWCRPIVRMGYDKKHNLPIEKKVMLANTGTFLRGYEKNIDTYVEINPKEAKRVGTVTLTLNPETGSIYGHD